MDANEDLNSTMVGSDSQNCTIYRVECMEQLYSIMVPLKRYMGYGTLMWFGVGLFGNILSIIVWTSARMRKENSSAIFLAALSISDLITISINMIIQLSFFFGINTYQYPVICETIFIPQVAMQHLSTTLVLAFTIERWIAICFPFRRDSLCTPKRAVIVVIGLTILSLSIFSLYGYLLYYDPNTGKCEVRKTNDAMYLMYYYQSTNEFVFSAGLPICTLVFNLLVIRELQRIAARSRSHGHMSNGAAGASQGNDSTNFKSTTAMLLSVSFFLIITALPEGATFSLQQLFSEGRYNLTLAEIKEDYVWQRHFQYYTVKLITSFISQSHNACNFIIYFCTGRLYRAFVMRLFGIDRCMRLRGFHPTDADEYRHKYSTIDGPGGERLRVGDGCHGNSSIGGEASDVSGGPEGGRDSRKRGGPMVTGKRRGRGQQFLPSSNPRKSNSGAPRCSNAAAVSQMTYV